MKNKIQKNKHASIIWILLLGAGCAASPEESSPGTCSLNCSKKRVGATEYGTQRLFADKIINLPCSLAGAQSGISPHNGPVQVRYLVYETVPSFTTLPEPSTGGGGGGAAGGGGATGGSLDKTPSLSFALLNEEQNLLQSPALAPRVPKPGIGFEPVLFGSVSIEKTNPEFKTNPTEATPFKFAGVVTPSSEWCTDSCGVATFEFWPNCVTGGQTVQAAIFIQNTPVQETYEFNLAPF